MTLVLLGNYAQTGPLRAARLHAVQRRHAPGRPRTRRSALRLPAAQASLQRQVHAGGGPLCADLLCAMDGHGRGARAKVQGHGRSPLLRRPRRRDAVGRRARVPARRRRPQNLLADNRPPTIRCSRRRKAAVSARSPAASVRRRHQRRQRRPLRCRHRDRSRQGGILGHRRRFDRVAEDRRVRRRVRAVLRPCAGAEDAGDGAQAASGSASSSPTTTPASTTR